MNDAGDDQTPSCSKDDAKKIFRQSVQGGSVIFTRHCRERMKERDVDNNDLLALSRTGIIHNPPEPHIRTGELTYRIERSDPVLKVVFSIPYPNKVRIITVEN